MTNRMPLASGYAPYTKHPAFTQGVAAYAAGAYASPYAGNSVEAQAWDRGLEFAMKLNQWQERQ
jgi:hypothetical protein